VRPSSSLVNDFERQKLSHHFLKAEAARNRIDAANSRHIRRLCRSRIVCRTLTTSRNGFRIAALALCSPDIHVLCFQRDTMTGPRFVHLHVHSAYSLLEGALPVKALAKLAAADKQPALAITDRNNLFGALEFSEALAGEGIQPILGCALNVRFPNESEEAARSANRAPAHHGALVLLAKDAAGYSNLMRLSSLSFLEHSGEGAPHISFADLSTNAGNLICLSGGPEGPVDRAFANGNAAIGEGRLQSLRDIFGDRFYVELQRHSLPRERLVEPQLLRWAYDKGVPLVASNEAYFPKREAYEAHDALLCIAEGRYVAEDDRRRLTQDHGLKTQKEMAALFADLPEAVENTLEIAKRCAFRPTSRKPILPQFVLDAADAGMTTRKSPRQGLRARRVHPSPRGRAPA